MKQIENFDVAPWMKKIIYILFYCFIAISLLIPFFVYYMSKNPPDFNKMQQEVYIKHNFSGVVKETYIDESNHSARTILLTNGNKVVTNPFLSSELKEGDSIEKKEGDSWAKIYKKDGRIVVYDLIKNKSKNEK